MRRLTFLMLSLLVLSACQGAERSPTLDTPVQAIPTATAAVTPTATVAPTSTSSYVPSPMPQADSARFAEQRERMVRTTIEARGVQDPSVLQAMRAVLRHQFVLDDYQDMAYADRPLPIGYGQTISQPYIVAWMTELLELEPGAKVLEIGTGSGYQAAVLAELPDVEVYTIEIVPDLAEQAQQRLARLGYTEIQTRQGDGYYGWPEHAPFDAIIVTAAPDHLPQPLAEQLADGGRLVIPIGPPGSYQSLWQFTRAGDSLEARNLGGVAFVPFTGPGIEGAGP
jgi:protein-L-isoaspartate(D-aspartate) O-methyltransferase